MFPRAIIACLLLGLVPGAVPAADANLRITGTNIQTDQGSFIVWVYENAETWLGTGKWRTQKVVKVAGNRLDNSITVKLTLPPGEYALSVFQDIDDDGQLARNFIGIPKEPAGLSNNLRPRFGPPKFKDARFSIGEALVEQRIELR